MSRALRLQPPAKLNLGLRVVGRRPDGFHELETVFCAIDLRDELIARRSAGGLRLTLVRESSQGLPVAAGEDNLVLRAARAVVDRLGRTDAGLEFRLVKRIPAGGGLGGGSSDAAAALRLADALLGAELDAATLDALALRLGADVPFFLRGGTCFARGVGERLTPLPDDPPRWFVLLMPPFGTPTRRVFELLGARLIGDGDRDRVAGDDLPTATELALTLQQRNDLEPAAMATTPALRALRDRVCELGFTTLRMSGSGSTFFIPCDDAASAARIEGDLRRALGGEARVQRAASLGPIEPPQPWDWPGEGPAGPGEGEP